MWSEPEGARPGQRSCDGRAPILSTHMLTKQFGSLRAVDGLGGLTEKFAARSAETLGKGQPPAPTLS